MVALGGALAYSRWRITEGIWRPYFPNAFPPPTAWIRFALQYGELTVVAATLVMLAATLIWLRSRRQQSQAGLRGAGA